MHKQIKLLLSQHTDENGIRAVDPLLPLARATLYRVRLTATAARRWVRVRPVVTAYIGKKWLHPAAAWRKSCGLLALSPSSFLHVSLPTSIARVAQLQVLIKSLDLVLAHKSKVWKFRRNSVSRDHSFSDEGPWHQ